MHFRYHKSALENTHESDALQDRFHIAKYKISLSLNPGYNVAKTHNKQKTRIEINISYHFTACFAKNPRAIRRNFNMCLSNQIKVNFRYAVNTGLFTRQEPTVPLNRGLGESQSRE